MHNLNISRFFSQFWLDVFDVATKINFSPVGDIGGTKSAPSGRALQKVTNNGRLKFHQGAGWKQIARSTLRGLI